MKLYEIVAYEFFPENSLCSIVYCWKKLGFDEVD